MKPLDLLTKVTPVLGIAAFGFVGEHGSDSGLITSFVKDIWAGLKTASPPVAMVMFFLYLRADSERKEAQRQCNERTLDFVKTTNRAWAALEKALARLMRRTRQVRRSRR